MTAEQMFGEHGLLKTSQKRAMKSILDDEMSAHLGYEPHAVKGRNSGNSRNGKTKKAVQTATERVEINVPRDRNGSFEPQLIPKGERRLPELDEKVIALYARGNSTREIQSFLEELYGVEISPTLVSSITDRVMEDVHAWRSNPVRTGPSRTKPCTSPWESTWTARKNYWAYGSPTTKGKNSGYRSSTN